MHSCRSTSGDARQNVKDISKRQGINLKIKMLILIIMADILTRGCRVTSNLQMEDAKFNGTDFNSHIHILYSLKFKKLPSMDQHLIFIHSFACLFASWLSDLQDLLLLLSGGFYP